MATLHPQKFFPSAENKIDHPAKEQMPQQKK
jgi:hypothetical protein